MKTIKGSENYQCKVFKIQSYKKHPNADKLFIVTVDFNNVITGVEPTIGDLYVYFPLLSEINKDFISSIDGFREKELNKNKENAGFFEKSCRVKPVKLRGLPSEGYMHPVKDIEEFLGVKLKEGDEFNSYGDIKFCSKYQVVFKEDGRKNTPKKPSVNRVIDNQFFFHNDTENFRKNYLQIQPTDLIEVSYKKHGTSAVIGSILVQKKLTFIEKALKFFGVKIADTEYDVIYSSRRVLKNSDLNKGSQHYYDVDIWKLATDRIKNKIPKGYSLYCEIVGYLPNGNYIQKPYDYGVSPGDFEVYVYKITTVNSDGFVINLSPYQIKQFCDKYGLNFSNTLIYYGYAKDLFPELNTETHWNENFLRKLEETYVRGEDCYMCLNKVPAEGIVIVKEDMFKYEAFKLKNFRFLEYESKSIDETVENIEDNS